MLVALGRGASGGAGQRPAVSALNGMKVVEVAESGAADIATIAACFTGLLASQFGAEVTRVELAGERTNGGMSRDGVGSALYSFLNRSKTIASAMPPASDAILVTALPAIADRWPSQASVVIGAAHSDKHVRDSELTVQATSGLLDVFKNNNGEKFVALPGNQMAYASGLAAFNALVATQLARCSGKPLQRCKVNIADVACWINWKKFLSAREGIRQPQEWLTVRCSDGYFTLVYQDKHVRLLGELTGSELLSQPNMTRRAERHRCLEQFRKEIENWAKSRTRAEIFAAARRLRVPIGPVLGLAELAEDEQFKFRDFLAPDSGRTFPRLPLVVRRRGSAVARSETIAE